ncbi:hypothetical protein V8F06_006667 [Rhypophila decipiens]
MPRAAPDLASAPAPPVPTPTPVPVPAPDLASTTPALVDLLTDVQMLWMRPNYEGMVMAVRHRDRRFVRHLQQTLGTPQGVLCTEHVHKALISALDNLSNNINCLIKGIRSEEDIVTWLRRRSEDEVWIKESTWIKKHWPEFVYRLIQARKAFEVTASAEIKALHLHGKFCPDLSVAVNRLWLLTSEYWECHGSAVLSLIDSTECMEREHQFGGWTADGHETWMDWAMSESNKDQAPAQPLGIIPNRVWVPAKEEPLEDIETLMALIDTDWDATPEEMHRMMSYVDFYEEEPDMFNERQPKYPEPTNRWRSSITGGWEIAHY